MRIISIVSLLCICLPHINGQWNVDPKFSRWTDASGPNPTEIYYYFDNYYTTTEQGYVRAAMNQFQTGVGGTGCLSFVQVASTDTRFKVKITPYNESGVLQTFCYSYPGRHNPLYNANPSGEQIMVLTRGADGCLDGRMRPIMHILALLVGRRNEHQRQDRDQFITVTQANIRVPNSYRLYNSSENYIYMPYDYCSITHNQPGDYAVAGTNVFTTTRYPNVIPYLGQLSNSDCVIITKIYQCTTTCAALNCTALQLALAPPTTPAPTTALSTVTTTPSSLCSGFSQVCNNAPSESGFLLGPYQLYETLTLYSGPCALEYKFDFTNRRFVPTANGVQPITSYISSPGGATAPVPVGLAYDVVDPSGSFLELTLVGQTTSTALTCDANPVFSNQPQALSCPNSATTTDATAIRASGLCSSVSSQIYLLDYTVKQYCVTKSSGDTEIALFNEDFSQQYQTTTGCLSGQTTLSRITAIQILQDENFINPQQFAVFGVGADGVTPYVGFPTIDLNAAPTTPLSCTWTTQPIPLNQAITGCPTTG